MSDIEKAIEILNYFKNLKTIKYTKEEEKTYDLAISALEKQIPIKIKKVEYNVESNIDDGIGGLCPVCNSFVGGYSSRGNLTYKAKYCLDCGQRLDWEA